jgi:hypothetical protein
MRSVQIAELNTLMAEEIEVTGHDSDQRGEEDGERAEHCDECCGFVDELPGLDNPAGDECY